MGFEPTPTGALKKRFSVCDLKEFVDYYKRKIKANFDERIYVYYFTYTSCSQHLKGDFFVMLAIHQQVDSS